MTEELEFTGLLKPEEEKRFGKTLDEIINFKEIFEKKKIVGIAFELIDGTFFTAMVREVDDRLADRIPCEYKTDARAVLLAIINQDWLEVSKTVPVLTNKVIDIPGLTEDDELALLVDFCTLIYNAALRYAEKKLKEV